MTPDEQARIRELPKLISNENDPEKMKKLAAELQRLLYFTSVSFSYHRQTLAVLEEWAQDAREPNP